MTRLIALRTLRALRSGAVAMPMFLAPASMVVTPIVVAGALSSCSGAVTTQQVIADVNLVLGGFQKLLPYLSGVVSAAELVQIQTWLADAQAAAAGLATTPTSGTFAQQFFVATENILGVVAGLGVVPAPFNLIVSALVVLLPVIASALGVPVSASATVAKLMTKVPTMTPAQARAVLAQK